MRSTFFLFFISLQMILLTSCAPIRIESVPSGAKVNINGRNFGTTPTNPIKISRSYPIQISKEGYETYSGIITSNDTNPYRIVLEENAKERSGFISITIISEDGKIIAKKENVHAETDTIERSPNVSSVRRVTNSSEFAWIGFFQISPLGKDIIFESYEEEMSDGKTSSYSNLWSIPTAGGPVRRITQGKYFDRSPSFSLDGNNLYFSSNRLDSFDIWRLSYLTGSGLGLITNSSTMHENFPAPSRDDSTILFSSMVRGSNIEQIWKLGTKNSELYQLREGKWPRWFKSDNAIVFSSLQRTTGEWKIWSMNQDGSNPMQISTTSGSNDIHASVSPNGKKIVFASDRGTSDGKKNYDIWISDIDGNNLTQLTTNGSHDDFPVFSPDGNTIYFRSNRGIKWDIWAMNLAIQLG